VRKILTAGLAALVLALPLSAGAAPDEAQKQLIQRTQEAKKQLAAAQAAQGAERQKMLQEHMKTMQAMMAQMQKAKPAGGMKPEQMREWMDEHHMMMQGGTGMGGMQGMGKK